MDELIEEAWADLFSQMSITDNDSKKDSKKNCKKCNTNHE